LGTPPPKSENPNAGFIRLMRSVAAVPSAETRQRRWLKLLLRRRSPIIHSPRGVPKFLEATGAIEYESAFIEFFMKSFPTALLLR